MTYLGKIPQMTSGKAASAYLVLPVHVRLRASVVGPHHFNADPDAEPDFTYHPDADPDFTYHPDADPYSDFLFDADPAAHADSTFHPDASFQIKAQTIEKVLK
jgi:hypothetical protein